MFPALVAAAATLVQGLMAQKAAKEKQVQETMLGAVNQNIGAQQAGVQTQLQGNNNAFQGLMDNYKSAFLGK